MKFILIIVLAGQSTTPSITSAEFDDKDACDSARILTIPMAQERANVFVNARCFPKASPASQPKKK